VATGNFNQNVGEDGIYYCTSEGLFEFNVLPFCLCIGPVTFQWLYEYFISRDTVARLSFVFG